MQPTVDTESDSQQPDTVRLVRERNTSTPQFHVYLTEECRAAGIEPGDSVAWDLLPPEAPEEPPMLLCQRVPEDQADMLPATRTVSKQKTAYHVSVPTDVLGRDRNLPDADPVQLGLDVADYDPDNPLHFQPLVDEGVVALVPVGYDDGRLFRFDSERGVGYAVENVAGDSEQRAASSRSPISPDTVAATANETGVDADALRETLDALDGLLEPESLSPVEAYPPLETDDATVYIVENDVLDDLLEEHIDAVDLRDAARQAHLSAAKNIIRSELAREYRDATLKYNAVVLSK